MHLFTVLVILRLMKADWLVYGCNEPLCHHVLPQSKYSYDCFKHVQYSASHGWVSLKEEPHSVLSFYCSLTEGFWGLLES